MHPMLNVAIKAVRKASTVILKPLSQLTDIEVSEKGHQDFVTEVDRLAEEEIIAILKESYPDHNILAEESGALGPIKEDEYTWIIDPLDGTTNFIHGVPHFAISVAVMHKNKLEHGVVYDPIMQEWFSASRGAGAQLNGKRLRVSPTKRLEQSLIGTGFPFREPKHFKFYLNTFETIFPQTSGIRRAGSAALDLAYVAAGRFDGFWEISLNPWDMAAGVLLIKESGGIVTDFHGESDYLDSGNVIAGNPKIHRALLNAVQKNLKS